MSDNDMTADDYKDRNFRDDVKAVEVSSEEATLDEAYKKVYMHLKGQDIKPMVEKKKVSNRVRICDPSTSASVMMIIR